MIDDQVIVREGKPFLFTLCYFAYANQDIIREGISFWQGGIIFEIIFQVRVTDGVGGLVIADCVEPFAEKPVGIQHGFRPVVQAVINMGGIGCFDEDVIVVMIIPATADEACYGAGLIEYIAVYGGAAFAIIVVDRHGL